MRVENTNERLDENIRRLFEVETMGMECNNETAASLRDRAVMNGLIGILSKKVMDITKSCCPAKVRSIFLGAIILKPK